MLNKTNVIRNNIWIIFLIVLVIDFVQANYHFSNLPLDGDLVRISAPFKWYEDVLDDPVGIKAITENKKYPGAARYSVHQTMVWWWKYVNEGVRIFVKNPIQAVYLTSTLLAIITHLLFVWLAFQYAKANEKWKLKSFVTIALLASVFIQYKGYYETIGIIDRSITYVYCYAFPVLLLLWYSLPFYKHEKNNGDYQISYWRHLLMIVLVPILSFSSVLIQPLIIIFSGLYFIGVFIKNPFFKIRKNKALLLHLLFFFAICTYAYFVSKYNTEGTEYSKSIIERYGLMIKGLGKILTYKLSWALVILGIFINSYLIYKNSSPTWQRLKPVIYFVLAFCAVYILLLPLGGYRVYRPFIIRYDTFLPITLGFTFLLFRTTYINFHTLKNQQWLYYCLGFCALVLIFFMADFKSEKEANYCQQGQLYQMYESKDTTIRLPYNCQMLTWSKDDIANVEHMKAINVCLKRWKIIDEYQNVEFYLTPEK